MIETVIDGLGLRRAPLALAAKLAGRTFLRHWTSLGPCGDGRQEFRFMVEVDPSALRSGGSPHRARASLRLDGDGRPVTYVSEDGEHRLEIAFGDVTRVTLADGSVQTIASGRVDAVLENNHPGQSALLLALEKARAGGAGLRPLNLFLVSALTVVDYRLEPLDSHDAVFCSSLQEEITIGPDGRMLRLSMPAAALLVEPATDAPPEWSSFLRIAPRPVYAVPKDARFTSLEWRVDGPRGPIGATFNEPDRPTGVGALLIAGSGAVDRHGFAGEIDVGTHEIADHLSNRGIATLRYDKRGVGATPFGEDSLGLGFDPMIDEASACLAALSSAKSVGSDRVIAIGHSLGGLIAMSLSVEQRGGRLPLALLACPGRPMDTLIDEQIATRASLLGLDQDTVELQRRDFSAFTRFAASSEEGAEGAPAHLRAGVNQRRFFAQILERNPLELVARQRAPLLICNGELDAQVHPERDARALWLASQSNPHAELRLFDDLDHFFKPTTKDERLTAYFRERNVNKEFLEVLTEWTLERAFLPRNFQRGTSSG